MAVALNYCPWVIGVYKSSGISMENQTQVPEFLMMMQFVFLKSFKISTLRYKKKTMRPVGQNGWYLELEVVGLGH